MATFDPAQVTLRDGAEVTLASPTVDDAQALLDYLDRVRHETSFLLWGPADELFTLEQEQQWIRDQLESPTAVLIGAWQDGRLIGLGGVAGGGRLCRSRHRAELGISLLADWCDRGLGTALTRELVTWARHHPDLCVVHLSVYSNNPRAVAVYRKTGFIEEGRRRWAVRMEDGTFLDNVIMSCWVGEGDPPVDA